MSLKENILGLLDLTRALAEKLECDDLAACGDLLAERGRQMEQLSHLRQHAGEIEFEECAELLDQLTRRDAALQQQSQAILAKITQERNRMHTPIRLRTDANPLCIDRKA